MHKRTFTSSQKAAIVLSVLRKEVTVPEAAAKHNIVPSLIHKWQTHFLSKAEHIFDTPREETAKEKQLTRYEHVIGKLTTQNDFLERVLAVMK
jgi:transposase-like protein